MTLANTSEYLLPVVLSFYLNHTEGKDFLYTEDVTIAGLLLAKLYRREVTSCGSSHGIVVKMQDFRTVNCGFESQKTQWLWQEEHLTSIYPYALIKIVNQGANS